MGVGRGEMEKSGWAGVTEVERMEELELNKKLNEAATAVWRDTMTTEEGARALWDGYLRREEMGAP